MSTVTAITIPGSVWDDYLDPGATAMHRELGLDSLVARSRRVGAGRQVTYIAMPVSVATELADYLSERAYVLLSNDPPEERDVHRRALKTAQQIRDRVEVATGGHGHA